ncbi:HalOD1 output domain-containing protein [Halorussus litoreus]|uniref:HalOD1 output domain-containing protein n=1 Tax=Halorussus litoreus TaxID=1710536 RepID=UPI0013002C89|nr:HalOD1 output domain-containing protein [Halorussus litoreus]
MKTDTEPSTERVPSLDRDGRAAYRVESSDRKPSTTVVHAVAELSGTDPLGGGAVLYDVVNPDALDRLFADRHDGTSRPVGRISFELRGCRVEVRSDHEVVVYEPVDGRGESRSSATGSA